MPPGTFGQYPDPPAQGGPGATRSTARRGGWALLRDASAEAGLALAAWLLVLVGCSAVGGGTALLLRFCIPRLRHLPPTQHGFWSGAGALVQAVALPLLATASAVLLVTSAAVVALCLLLLLLPAAVVGGPIYYTMRLYARPEAAQHALALGFAGAALLLLLRLLRTPPSRRPADRGIEGLLLWYFVAGAIVALLVPHDSLVDLVRWLVQRLR